MKPQFQLSPRPAAPSASTPSRELLTQVVLVCGLLALLVTGCGGEATPASPSPAPAAAPHSASANTDPAALRESVHAELACSDCHPGAEADAKTVQAGETRCSPCHESATREVASSAHASNPAGGKSPASICAACHGAHDIAAVSDHPGLTPQAQQFGCVHCHRNPEAGAQFGVDPKHTVAQYFETIHARAVIEDGLAGAPDCLDCHGTGHRIIAVEHADSPTHPQRIAETCGRCHAGAIEEYRRSIHAQGDAPADRRPSCPDCHLPHAVDHPEPNSLCGGCHADRLERYLTSHHGQARALGDATVAVCSDCHGTHAILPSTDADSTLSGANREATCAQCHANATASFANFAAHPDPRNSQHYPLLYWLSWSLHALLIGALLTFLTHTVLWTVRSGLLFLGDRQAFIAKRQRWANDLELPFQRFSAVDRFSHGLLAGSFLLLVATGMPLKFSDAPWAQSLSNLLGGVRVAAGLHRLGAALIFVAVILHLVSVVYAVHHAARTRARAKTSLGRVLEVWRSPDSLTPRFQDLRDLWAHLRWFVGRGPRPTFDRFAYWEKLDYFAVFWGLMIIGASGLVMLAPVWTAQVLPGWFVNVAQMIHSDEALLVAGFIFLVHFFNIHFRLERFPLDLVMFSGRISEEQMREERARQYARYDAEGRLAELRTRDDWGQWKPIASALGLFAVAFGTVLVVSMTWGAVAWLWEIAQ